MRIWILALAVACSSAAARAETWLMREGVCGELRSEWDVEQEDSGVWAGIIRHVHVGGPCAHPTGQGGEPPKRRFPRG